MNLPLDLNEISISNIITSYNSYLFRDGSLSEQYFQLTQIYTSRIEEYNRILEQQHLLTAENCNLIDYVSSVPLTFNEQRSKITEKVVYDNGLELMILRLYGKVFDISHRIISQLALIKDLSSVSLLLEQAVHRLTTILTNIKKSGRKTLFKAFTYSNKINPFSSELLKYSKINVIESYLKFFPDTENSGEILQDLINTVWIK